jgi:hypothetical protein
MTPGQLTIRDAQLNQPWTLPYTAEVEMIRERKAMHALFHMMKTLGKMAAAFEQYDHTGIPPGAKSQAEIVKDMASDSLTIALRIANLYGFDLVEWFVKRTTEKNGKSSLDGLS